MRTEHSSNCHVMNSVNQHRLTRVTRLSSSLSKISYSNFVNGENSNKRILIFFHGSTITPGSRVKQRPKDRKKLTLKFWHLPLGRKCQNGRCPLQQDERVKTKVFKPKQSHQATLNPQLQAIKTWYFLNINQPERKKTITDLEANHVPYHEKQLNVKTQYQKNFHTWVLFLPKPGLGLPSKQNSQTQVHIIWFQQTV